MMTKERGVKMVEKNEFYTSGEVIHGKQLGRKLGMPTANVMPPKHKIMPPNGVYSSRTIVKDVNWINQDYFDGFKELSVKYRYRQHDIKANVRFIDKTTIEVINIDKAKATTPGQECVFYDGEVCLGGGTISEVIK